MLNDRKASISTQNFKRASTPTVTKSKMDFNIFKINTPNYKQSVRIKT